MIGKNIRAYTTGKSRRRIAIVLLLLLALLGIGIGGLPNGGEQTQPVTVTAEEQDDDDSSDEGDETGDGSSNDQDGSAGEEESQSTNEDNNDAEGADTVDDTGSLFTTTGNSQSGVSSNSQGTPSPVDIIVNKSEMNGQVDSVMPGDSGNVTLNVTNDGNGTGTFRVTTSNVTDYENGLTEPEAEVDASGSDPGEGEGELSAHLEVRWSLINSTGDRVYLTDNDSNDDYVPIRTLNDEQIQGGTIPANESADALFEWKVPKATGNEIQGDAVEFDVDFTLVSS